MSATFADAMLAWLATYAIHSTLLIGATMLATRHGALTAPARDFAWKLAMIGAILTSTIQLAVGVRPWGSLALEEAPAAAPAVGATTPAPDATVGVAPADAAGQSAPVSSENVRVAPGRAAPDGPVLPKGFKGRSPAPVSDANVRVAPGRTAPDGPPSVGVDAQSATPANADLPTTLTLFALGAWGVVAFTLALAWVVRRLLLAGRLTTRRTVTEGRLRAHLDRLIADCDYDGIVHLTSAPTIASPVALGLNEICVPEAALTDLDDEQMRGLLAHELAHLVRRDPLWLDVASLIERVFFFQPLNRLARAELQRNAEYICDDWAAARNGSGEPLARCLARVAEWIEASPLGVPVAGMAEQRSLLVSRIARLLEGPNMKNPLSRATMALLTVVALGVVVAAAPAVHRMAPTEDEQQGDSTQRGYATTRDRDAVLARARGASIRIRGKDLAELEAMTEARAERGAAQRAERDAERAVSADLKNFSFRGMIEGFRGGRDLRGDREVADSVEQDPTVVTALIERLSDTHPAVRRAAANSLGNLRARRAVSALITALSDKNREVRSAAAEALGSIQDTKAVPALVKLLSDDTGEVRESAINALESFNEDVPASAMIPVLADSRPRMRAAAANILGNTGDRAAIAPLSKLLKDPVAAVRHQALDALERFRDPSVVAAVQPLMTDESADVRMAAMQTLRELNAPVPEAAVLKALDDPNMEVRQHAVELTKDQPLSATMVAALRKLVMEEGNADVRTSAIEALAEARNPAAREAIKAALSSSDARVRRAAVEALGQRP
ncbi:MAG: HEAT repeat domain-containing protein [Gemmatimonadetes bacterium]|nr:HEAT repeat domain-containing protein [Gemmatimonadota bacterium]